MRSTLSILVLMLLTASVKTFAQSADCKQFKNGMFKTTYKGVTDIIKRTGSEQTEHFEGSSAKPHHYIVKWLDDCTYTLTPSAELLAENKEIPRNIVFTVHITNTTKDSYTQTMTDNLGKFNMTSVMIKIEFDMEMYIKGGQSKKSGQNN